MISGSKLRLRAVEPEDSEKYFLWINDDETNQWRGFYPPTSREEAAAWIAEMRKSADALSFAIELNDGTHIGFIGLRQICRRSMRAEIWIYIGDKNYWHQGYGEDAIKTLCRSAFNDMNLFRIWLECNPEFSAVVNCYKKVGFVQEGLLRKAYYRDGKFRDTCIMGLLRDDWKAS